VPWTDLKRTLHVRHEAREALQHYRVKMGRIFWRRYKHVRWRDVVPSRCVPIKCITAAQRWVELTGAECCFRE
jgi:hypothetical protein